VRCSGHEYPIRMTWWKKLKKIHFCCSPPYRLTFDGSKPPGRANERIWNPAIEYINGQPTGRKFEPSAQTKGFGTQRLNILTDNWRGANSSLARKRKNLDLGD
jgi:hypothetical protein